MDKTIFEFTSYKTYLISKIHSFPSKGRGMKLKIADFLNCQNTFVSQVLNGEANFTLEQGEKINQFFTHTKEERKYFLNLIHLERASSPELKNHYQEELNEIILKNTDLKKRTNMKGGLREKDHDTYYSSWLYSAAHILTTIKDYRSASAIAKKLNLSKNKANEILDFLAETGLISKEGNHFLPGLSRIHLEKNSPNIQKHHINWRLRAINSIELNLEEDLHFSNVVSMSQQDIIKVRELFIKTIAEARAIIKDSPEEKLQSICLDFFEV